MKRKDVTVIVAIACVAALFAAVLSKIFITTPKNLQQTAEVVEPISAQFNEPDNRFLNTEAINPTRIIRIGESVNENPFR